MFDLEAPAAALNALSGTAEHWGDCETPVRRTPVAFRAWAGAEEGPSGGEQGHRSAEVTAAYTNRIVAVRQMSASIVHEINQPLAALMMNVQAALRFLDSSQPDLKEVQDALIRIVRLGHRIVEVAGRTRALVQRLPPRKEDFEINDAIREVITLCQEDLVKGSVAVSARFARDLPLVCADRVQLQQVILNLITNAAEAMRAVPEETRELRISTGRASSGEILVVVQDSGPGVDTQKRDRMFDAFCTTKADGLGIGLFICRSIIEAHGGRLWATECVPHGARFEFTLPLHASASCPAWSGADSRRDLEAFCR